MDEDMSRLSADDSRLSDTNSLMVRYLIILYLLVQHDINNFSLGRKASNIWNSKTCYRIY